MSGPKEIAARFLAVAREIVALSDSELRQLNDQLIADVHADAALEQAMEQTSAKIRAFAAEPDAGGAATDEDVQ